ncbi:MAG: NAD(P)-binding domain-containing protein [Cytophagales bacterium]|nr:NAD(P)-binding domain-containing protein [Cytophagales bacterium]
MKIGILGTGTVGTTLGSKLIQLGHEVKLGSRSAGNEKAAGWVRTAGSQASQGTFADAAAFGELILNCTSGGASLEALRMAEAGNLRGKVLVDVANPLDFSQGQPPTLLVSNTDSLGEQIQAAFPEVKVVKALNTMWSGIMVNPRMLPDTHHTFLSGNDPTAKASVKQLLRSFGWQEGEIVDLGDITTARGTEMILPLWIRIWGVTQNGAFNFKIVS